MRLRTLFASIAGMFVFVVGKAESVEQGALPQALIIGDSISIGYTYPLEKILKGKVAITHNPGNAQHSRHGLASLDKWLGNTKWDVIHFNHGLHDLKYVNARGKNSSTKENAHIQVPLEDYEKNMEAIVIRLKKTGAKLIFATTTPYPEGVNPLRDPEDAVKYNEVALKIMKKHGVAVNDLYSLVLPEMRRIQQKKNVHFNKNGSKHMAEAVAKHIMESIEK